MSATYFRYDGTVQTPLGLAVPGASIAVLDQPSDFTTQPGTPLATIYGADNTNSATITGALWEGGQITFTLSATPPTDVVEGSYIAVSGVTPSTFDTTLEAPYLVMSVVGNTVIVASLTSPGTYVSGGTVASSVLPNPLTSDNNGNYYFYTLPGIYSVQIYSPTITERDYPDQGVGTVAGGSVLSVALALPAEFDVSGSPVTTSGTLSATWAVESANLVFAGPGSGSPATPGFRALVADDLPGGTGTVSSVAHTLTVPASIMSKTVTGSPITTSGTIADTITLVTQSANLVWAGPTSGGAATPTFRALVTNDLPAVGFPATRAFTNQILAAPVSVMMSTETSIDAITVTMPASGGPWRVLLRYQYFQDGGVAYTAGISDGTNWFATSQGVIHNNNSCMDGSELTYVTYADGAMVTFTCYTFNSGASTVVLAPGDEGTPGETYAMGVSHMSATVQASA